MVMVAHQHKVKDGSQSITIYQSKPIKRVGPAPSLTRAKWIGTLKTLGTPSGLMASQGIVPGSGSVERVKRWHWITTPRRSRR